MRAAQAGDDIVPFHRFAALVKNQVTKLRDAGSPEVAFRVAMKEGKVNFTVRASEEERSESSNDPATGGAA